MILLVVAVVAGLVVALARGGRLESLANTRLRWIPLLLLGLAIQVLLDVWTPEALRGDPATRLVVIANIAVAAWLVANRKHPGMLIALVGLVLNIVVIAANGAMPVSADAARVAGVERSLDDPGLKHERLTDDTVLPWLGDVIPMPGLREAISVGDIVLALGIGWFVYRRTAVRDGDERASAGRRSRSSD